MAKTTTAVVDPAVLSIGMNETQVAALEEMSAPLQGVYGQIHGILSKQVTASLKAKYKVGELVNRTLTDERKYGEKQVEKLAAALGEDVRPNHLWQCAKVATVYSKQALEDLLQAGAVEGRTVSWSMLEVLSRLAEEAQTAQRLGYEAAIVDGTISNSKELSAEIAAGNNPDAPGEESQVQKTPEALKRLTLTAVNKQLEATAKLIESQSEGWAEVRVTYFTLNHILVIFGVDPMRKICAQWLNLWMISWKYWKKNRAKNFDLNGGLPRGQA